MKANVVISAPAFDDIDYILDDLTAKAGANVAARYDADFKALFRRLAELPLTGSPRPRLGPSVRVSVISPYVAIYEGTASEVVILRVVHGRRDVRGDMLRDTSN